MQRLNVKWKGLAYTIALIFLAFSNEIEHGLGILLPFRKVILYLFAIGLFFVTLLIKRQIEIPKNTTLKILLIQYFYYVVVTLISCFYRQNQSIVANLITLQFSFIGFWVGWQMEKETRGEAAVLLKRVAFIIVLQMLILYALNLSAGYDHNTFKPHLIIPIGKSNAIASILLVCMCSLLSNKKNIITTFFCFLGVVMTLSNSGLVATCIVLVLIMLCEGILTKKVVTRIFFGLFSLIILLGILSKMPVWNQLEIYFSRFSRTISVLLSDTSSVLQKTNGRSDLWNNAIFVFEAHPILGVGIGDYVLESGEVLGKTHNVVLQVGVWGGIIGITIFGTLVYALTQGGTGKRKELFMCCLVGVFVQAMVEPTFFTPAFDFFFWLYVGTQKYALQEDKENVSQE